MITIWDDQKFMASQYEASISSIGDTTKEETEKMETLYNRVADAIEGTGEEMYTLTNIPIGETFRKHRDEILRLQNEYSNLRTEIESLNDELEVHSLSVSKKQLQISEMQFKAKKEGRELTEEERAKIEELRLAIEGEQIEMDKLRIKKEELNLQREETKNKITEEQNKMIDFFRTMKEENDRLAVLIKQWNEYWKAREEGEGVPVPMPEVTTEQVKKKKGIEKKQIGAKYIPKNMLAFLHKGEAVVPAHKVKSIGQPVAITNNFDFKGTVIRSDADIQKLSVAISREIRKSLVLQR
jgi:chromosome segregation ATPase